MKPEIRSRIIGLAQSSVSDAISNLGSAANDEAVKRVIRDELIRFANEYNTIHPNDEETIYQNDLEELIDTCVSEFLYLGPLEPLLSDDSITEIMVNGKGFDSEGNMLPHEVYIERDGVLYLVDPKDVHFDDNDHVNRIMNRIVGRVGRQMNFEHPIEDAALQDGSRFNGTIYPLSPDGSTFNIRKFQKNRVNAEELVNSGTLTGDMMSFLAAAVASRLSIMISGGTGSGKTTLLNALSSFIPHTERIITIEDTCELLIHEHHPHVVRFEARKSSTEGSTITLNDHLIAALRKRPDRIIIGECRGPEAYTMLEAMNTGHEGSMTTIHANDPVAALTRLSTLVISGDPSISERTVNAKIADALDLVVQIARLPGGIRKVIGIEAINGFADGRIQHEPLYSFERTGIDDSGKATGYHHALNVQPIALKKKILAAGYRYDDSWFFDKTSGGEQLWN